MRGSGVIRLCCWLPPQASLVYQLTRPLTEKDDGSLTRSWFALSITVRTGTVPPLT